MVDSRGVLITGSVSLDAEQAGMALAVARQAAQRGHRVALLDASEHGRTETAAAALHCPVVRVDLGDAAAVSAAVAELDDALDLTALVNVAAIPLAWQVPFTRLTPFDIEAAVRLNLVGVLNAVRSVVGRFHARGGGVVVNLGSIAAAYPASGIAVYALTQAAVASVTRTLAAEYGRSGIHVQGVAPGVALTAENDQLPTAYRDALITHSVLGRPAQADEIAAAVVDVTERPNPLLAGHTVVHDGGLSPFGVRQTIARSQELVS